LIISESRRFVFIHNPKCGGTTVRHALMPYETTNNFFWMFDEVNGLKIDKTHMPMHVFRRLYPYYFDLLETCFVFMIVRDPYSRTVSSFNETNQPLLASTLDGDDQAAKRTNYIAKVNAFVRALTHEKLSGWKFGYRHFVRQRDMAYLGPKMMVDCVLKLEDLASTSTKIAVFDPGLRDTLLSAPRRHSGNGALTTREILDDRSVNKINEIYRDDFYLFDYKMW
jgi:hypothetical protein